MRQELKDMSVNDIRINEPRCLMIGEDIQGMSISKLLSMRPAKANASAKGSAASQKERPHVSTRIDHQDTFPPDNCKSSLHPLRPQLQPHASLEPLSGNTHSTEFAHTMYTRCPAGHAFGGTTTVDE